MNAQTIGWLVFLALIKNFSCGSSGTFELQDSHLKAKEGSCVEIKCTARSIVSNDDAYWFWIKNRKWNNGAFDGTIIYSTNSLKRPVSPDFADRVKYIGSPPSSWTYASSGSSPSPCNILICDLNKTDSGNYSFRFVGKPLVWATKTEVIVTVEENPCLIVFQKPPVVKETETITLACSTLSTCPSNPQIEGLTELSSKAPQNYKQHKSTTISFTADWKDDGKEFSCQIQDQADKYLVRNISVAVEYAPKDTLAMISPKNVIEGESVTLTCSTKGNPNATYTWFKNEQMQSPQADDKSHEWIITSIKDSQSGEYHCEAQNKHGKTKSNPVIINVTYAPNVEIIMTSPKPAIRQGDEITLTCNVNRSNPQPSSYIWLKDSRQIGWTQTYDVQSIQPEDSGTYTCTATNTAGTGTSQPFQTKVEYRPQKTRISIPGSHKTVKVGHSLTFTCETEANPVPDTYSWYRDSKNSSQWTSQTTSDNSLHLKSVQRADKACYICNATNRIDTGDDSPSFCIEVLYPPTNTTLSMDTEVREGQPITINCTVESFPLSSLTLTRTSTWSDRGSEWNIAKQAGDWPRDNKFSYTFNATSTDAGVYTCYAKNSEGQEKSVERKLVVNHTPKRVTVRAQPDLVVNENMSLKLVCSALSYPPVTSFTWMKTIDGKDVIVKLTQSFTLKSVTPSDSGLYSCTASNEIGPGKSQPVEVKVKYAPKHTMITRGAEQQLSDRRRAVMLSCSSHCYPPVIRYTWYRKKDGDKEYKKLTYRQNITVNSDSPGSYYCIAENEINQRMSAPVELFNSHFTKVLIFTFLSILLIIIIIVVTVLYRCRRKKSIQQVTSDRLPWWSCFGFLARRRNLVRESGLAQPSRSRDDLLPDQRRPDRTAVSNINTVYCTANQPRKQGPSAQKPDRKHGGHMEDDVINYASLYFGNEQKQSKTEQDTYAMVSKPKPPKKNEEETMEPYENIRTAYTAKSPNPLNYDSDTSEDEVDVNYSQVTFNTKPGHQRDNTDSSTSDEEYETQYSEVKI